MFLGAALWTLPEEHLSGVTYTGPDCGVLAYCEQCFTVQGPTYATDFCGGAEPHLACIKGGGGSIWPFVLG